MGHERDEGYINIVAVMQKYLAKQLVMVVLQSRKL